MQVRNNLSTLQIMYLLQILGMDSIDLIYNYVEERKDQIEYSHEISFLSLELRYHLTSSLPELSFPLP